MGHKKSNVHALHTVDEAVAKFWKWIRTISIHHCSEGLPYWTVEDTSTLPPFTKMMRLIGSETVGLLYLCKPYVLHFYAPACSNVGVLCVQSRDHRHSQYSQRAGRRSRSRSGSGRRHRHSRDERSRSRSAGHSYRRHDHRRRRRSSRDRRTRRRRSRDHRRRSHSRSPPKPKSFKEQLKEQLFSSTQQQQQQPLTTAAPTVTTASVGLTASSATASSATASLIALEARKLSMIIWYFVELCFWLSS